MNSMGKASFDETRVLVVGGAGFVGSNLVKMILALSPDVRITVVDNLLSAERINVPDAPGILFVGESVTNDKALNSIDDSYDYIFHLATYHGNQSSIHDPLADHENNTLTTLKLMNHIRGFRKIRKDRSLRSLRRIPLIPRQKPRIHRRV